MSYWPRVPVEAIRGSADFNGARTLVRLAGERATFFPDAAVELLDESFIARVRYVLPGSPSQVHIATMGLVWAPAESRRAAA